MDKKKKPALTPKEAKLKAANYCAYQERSQKEVRNKLYEYGLYRDEVEDVLTDLITDGFVSEERFAKTYAGGKFRMKKWGKNRIRMHLQQHNLSEYCIKKGLAEIEMDDYLEALESLIVRKADTLVDPNLYSKRNKVAKHLIFKGYESDLVWQYVKDLVE